MKFSESRANAIFFRTNMSFSTNNFVTVSNSNNNNNVIAASSSNKGLFTGAKFFKGATPGTIKKPIAGVTSMKTTIGFDGFTGVNAQVSKCSSPLGNNLFLASKPRTTHAPMFGSNKALQQAGKLVSDELASKFIVPSSACGNGGCPEHLENALAARQANNLAYIEKQRALHLAAPSPLRKEVRVTTVMPGDFSTLGAMIMRGKPVLIPAKIKNQIKTLLNQAPIGWVIPTKSGLGGSCLIRNGLKAYYFWNRKVPSGKPSKKQVKPY